MWRPLGVAREEEDNKMRLWRMAAVAGLATSLIIGIAEAGSASAEMPFLAGKTESPN